MTSFIEKFYTQHYKYISIPTIVLYMLSVILLFCAIVFENLAINAGVFCAKIIEYYKNNNNKFWKFNFIITLFLSIVCIVIIAIKEAYDIYDLPFILLIIYNIILIIFLLLKKINHINIQYMHNLYNYGTLIYNLLLLIYIIFFIIRFLNIR